MAHPIGFSKSYQDLKAKKPLRGKKSGKAPRKSSRIRSVSSKTKAASLTKVAPLMPLPPASLKMPSLGHKLIPATLTQIAAGTGLPEASIKKMALNSRPTQVILNEIMAHPDMAKTIGKKPSPFLSSSTKLAMPALAVPEKFSSLSGITPKTGLKGLKGKAKNILGKIKGKVTVGSLKKGGITALGFLLAEFVISLAFGGPDEQDTQNSILQTSQDASRAQLNKGQIKEAAKNNILLQVLLPALQNQASISQQAASAALTPGFNATNIAPSEIIIGVSGGGGIPGGGNSPDQAAMIQALMQQVG